MDVEKLEKRMEFWKRGLFVELGASVTLLVTTMAENKDKVTFWGWYVVWLIVWLAVAPPGFYLLMSKRWRQLALVNRLNTAFGYLGCAWMVLLSACIRAYRQGGVFGCYTFMVIVAGVLGGVYWFLRKKGNGPEEIFP